MADANEIFSNDMFVNEITSAPSRFTTLGKLQTDVLNKIGKQDDSYSSDGYINLNLIQRSIKKNNVDDFRFLGVKNRPNRDEVMWEKVRMSNGIILVNGVRTANVATETFGGKQEITDEISALEAMTN